MFVGHQPTTSPNCVFNGFQPLRSVLAGWCHERVVPCKLISVETSRLGVSNRYHSTQDASVWRGWRRLVVLVLRGRGGRLPLRGSSWLLRGGRRRRRLSVRVP